MKKTSYRPEIDGLRAIAILSVVLYHAGIGSRSGFAGVDVFFVISGYLLTWLLLDEKQRMGRIDLMAFYARRVRRIMPAACVVILTTIALSSVLLSQVEQRKIIDSAIFSALLRQISFFCVTAVVTLTVHQRKCHYCTFGHCPSRNSSISFGRY
jgi:peptidoglycan/LPS O-acetylase OafA/YrhL